QISFDSTSRKFLDETIIESGNAKTEKDASFNTTVTFFTDSVQWQQKLIIAETDTAVVSGALTYFVKTGEEYNNYDEPFKVTIIKAAERNNDNVAGGKGSLNDNLKNRSLFWIFLASFGGGLLAVITPCVFSMVPVTVSFFTKRSKTRAEGVKNAFFYSASIIIIFTLLGLLITLIFGPAALNKLATNWIANLVFFVLFLLFGISFLGAFEITLPSSWTNRASMKSGTGNFWGIFFMALTLVLVSFSCTGPIIGNLLVLASKGSFVGPLIGMFGFSLAMALPFFFFALFPGMLNNIGKAGGWLNAVKVTLGFLELALALKFLSNADLVQGWRLLDREIFIAIWMVIFTLLGVYLLGKIKFHHDDDLPKNDFGLPYLSVTRLFFAMTAFTFVVYMLPGMWGAPLKGISAFLPPYGTQDFVPSPASPGLTTHYVTGATQPTKYVKELGPYEPEVVKKYGLVTYFDYDEALAASRQLKKPLMLDFTGINCINCRKMEAQVWSNPEVMRRLKEDFVVVSLYTDVRISLPENEEFDSKELGEHVNTVGEKFMHLQASRFGSVSQPFYIFLDGKEEKLAPDGYGYDPDVQAFIKHLDKVKAEYIKRGG
ncbi:MAG TPA: cytochrome c biogenesis protein CcdA, partial [Chitinophagaceae bacterium]|nr:cytochrome c biogenesis protein CcdA [Chitinophagaceae bacterium]